MLRITIHAATQAVEQNLKPGSELRIGRSETPGQLLPEASPGRKGQLVRAGLRTLSQEHASIQYGADQTITFTDLGSTNGSFLRLPADEPVSLSPGSELLLGRELTVRLDGTPLSTDGVLGVAAVSGAEELLAFLKRRLGKQVEEITLLNGASAGRAGRGVGDGALRFPLVDRTQLVVSFGSATHNAEAESWLRAIVNLYNSQRSEQLSEAQPWEFTAVSPGRRQALWLARQVAAADCTVLIRGATGTGKEVLANDLHTHGPRAGRPFVTVNCGAIPATLAESILFGHAKGVFTGATESKQGLFVQADGGTLFLDEIGELSLDLQVKLLRALETRRILPVGGERERPIDVRVVAATHRPLEQMIEQRLFRDDLFYRLSTIQLVIPALAAPDLEAIATHILGALSHVRGGRLRDGELQEVAELAGHQTWPGGVRELRNALERYLLLHDGTRSASENWQMTIAAGRVVSEPLTSTKLGAARLSSPLAPAPDSATLTGIIPEQAPLTISKQIDTLLFLSLLHDAISKDPRVKISLIAERVGMTYQGVVNRLRSLDLRMDGKDVLARISERISEEQAQLQPYMPWIRHSLGSQDR